MKQKKKEWMEAIQYTLPQSKKNRQREAKERIKVAEKEAKKVQEDILGSTPGWDTNSKKL